MVEPWNPKEAVNVQWMECGESCPRGWEEVEKTSEGKVRDNLFVASTGGPKNLKTHNLAERYLLHFEDNPNESLAAKRKACGEMVKHNPDLRNEFERHKPCYYGIDRDGFPKELEEDIPQAIRDDMANFIQQHKMLMNKNLENEKTAIQAIPELSDDERERKIEETSEKYYEKYYEPIREYIRDMCTLYKDDWCTWCSLRAHELSEDKDGDGCGNYVEEKWVPNNKYQVKCKRKNATDVRDVDKTKWFGRGPFCRGRCPNKWTPLRSTKQGISGGNTLQRLPCWLGQKVECGRIKSSKCEDVDCSFNTEPDCLQCSHREGEPRRGCWWNSDKSECNLKSPTIDEDTEKCAAELIDPATLRNNNACRSYHEKENALAQCKRDIIDEEMKRKEMERKEMKRKEMKRKKKKGKKRKKKGKTKDKNIWSSEKMRKIFRSKKKR